MQIVDFEKLYVHSLTKPDRLYGISYVVEYNSIIRRVGINGDDQDFDTKIVHYRVNEEKTEVRVKKLYFLKEIKEVRTLVHSIKSIWRVEK